LPSQLHQPDKNWAIGETATNLKVCLYGSFFWILVKSLNNQYKNVDMQHKVK